MPRPMPSRPQLLYFLRTNPKAVKHLRRLIRKEARTKKAISAASFVKSHEALQALTDLEGMYLAATWLPSGKNKVAVVSSGGMKMAQLDELVAEAKKSALKNGCNGRGWTPGMSIWAKIHDPDRPDHDFAWRKGKVYYFGQKEKAVAVELAAVVGEGTLYFVKRISCAKTKPKTGRAGLTGGEFWKRYAPPKNKAQVKKAMAKAKAKAKR